MSKAHSEAVSLDRGEALLREARIGRLGTCREGEPYVIPISFVYDDGRIFFHGSKEGKKMEFIAANPRVCLEADEAEFVDGEDPCKLHWNYRSVVAIGRARVLEETGEVLAGLRLLVDKYSPGKGDLLTRDRVEGYADLAVVKIEVEEITEKRDPS